MIRGVKFVSVPVSDQDKALEFYRDVLGFRVKTDQPFTPTQRWIEMSIPGAETGLVLWTPPGQEDRIGSFQPVSLWCEDVFQTAEVLMGKGVEFAQAPKKESWGTSAIFKDPDGNRFVLSGR